MDFWYTVWMSSYRSTAVRVLRLRVKDKHAAWLCGLAREVNTVFNYCNELSVKVFERERRRRQHQKIRLAWRKSGGARRSLGWIPFKVRTIRYRGGQIYFAGHWLSLWDSYGLGKFELRAGNFSEDSRGRWYLNVGVPRAQQVDFLHKLSTDLVKANGALFVGNVNASALAKTRQAKSVLDAGWSTFRTMLQYQCADAGVWFEEVDEAFSTQTCSVCKSRAGAKGRKDLGIRGWQCTVCEAIHDRNVNAAHNILAAGHRRLAEGILGP
jgi:putative transposase